MIDENDHLNFANMFISVLESKISDLLGKEFINEMKKNYLIKQVKIKLSKAIQNAEIQFVINYPDNEISQVLSSNTIANLPSMDDAIWRYYRNPADTSIQKEIIAQMSALLPKKYAKDKIIFAMNEYFRYINEELSSIDVINEKLRTLAILRNQNDTQEINRTLHEIKDFLVNGNDQSHCSNFASTNSLLIESHTKGFVGRDFVFNEIKEFTKNTSKNGYFIIQGDPGIGKSAIIAELAKRENCIYHCNSRATGTIDTRLFLENISSQLISKYFLPYQYEEISMKMKTDSRFFMQMLDDISQDIQASNDNLLIAVDALDEVSEHENQNGNILYFPTVLPQNVFFILSTRRKSKALISHAPIKNFDLFNYPIENEKDIKLFLNKKITSSIKLKNYISDRSISPDLFVTKLTQKCDLNFMYLKSILLDMENGWYVDASLNELPQGLEHYYEDHWHRMGMTSGIDKNKLLMLKIVYILSVALFPVSIDEIASTIHENSILVQQIIDDWMQFLHIEIQNNSKYYSIYHNSFREFLHRKDIVKASKININEIYGLLAEKFKNSLDL